MGNKLRNLIANLTGKTLEKPVDWRQLAVRYAVQLNNQEDERQTLLSRAKALETDLDAAKAQLERHQHIAELAAELIRARFSSQDDHGVELDLWDALYDGGYDVAGR